MDVGVGAHVADDFGGDDVACVGVAGTGFASFENIDVDDDDHGWLFASSGNGAFGVGVGLPGGSVHFLEDGPGLLRVEWVRAFARVNQILFVAGML